MNKYKVSLIVPIFKVEKYIERCVRSLFEQSLAEVEFIFVDDCSPDNSLVILKGLINEYPFREGDVRIVKHDMNLGLPSARNSGLKVANGEYIFHCDSDDWMDGDMLRLMYEKALFDNADIVWCDWYLSFQNRERYMTQDVGISDVRNGVDILKIILGGGLKYNVWNKLVKRNLYISNDILFPDGFGMGEDLTMIKLFVFAKRVSYLNKGLYHYLRLNNEAFTNNITSKHLDQLQHNVEHIISYLKDIFGCELDDYINFFKLNVKFPFLISMERESYDRWNAWYKESNLYIDKNTMFDWRARFLQHMALNHYYWILKMYNFFIFRVVYGIIYKQ